MTHMEELQSPVLEHNGGPQVVQPSLADGGLCMIITFAVPVRWPRRNFTHGAAKYSNLHLIIRTRRPAQLLGNSVT